MIYPSTPLTFAVYFPTAKEKTGYIFAKEADVMTVKLFGITKEIIGNNKLLLDASHNINTVGDLKTWLSNQYPALQALKSLAVAVDSEYADDTHSIFVNSEVALIPPVSGG
jgi:sulfur-carrier protein